MVDRAEAQPVGDHRLALVLDVADYVGRVEEPRFTEAADRAAARVGGQDAAAELRLVHADARLPDEVAPLDRVLDRDGLRLVEGPDELPGRDEDRARGRVIVDHVRGNVRPVPARPRANEVDDRHLELVGGAEGAVVRLAGRTRAVGVDDALVGDRVAVRRLVRGLDRERRRSFLRGGAVDPLLAVQVRDAPAAEGKAAVEAAGVRDVLAVLRAEDGELGEARGADVVVVPRPIVARSSRLDKARSAGLSGWRSTPTS